MKHRSHDFLTSKGYIEAGSFKYQDAILSKLYVNSNYLIILDQLEIFDTPFSYKHYCQHQNELMEKFQRVYRFIDDDFEMLRLFLEDDSNDCVFGRTYDREQHAIDPSPLESTFETCFEEAYGTKGLNVLAREYSFPMKNGKIGYIDYALFKKDKSWMAIEENGISYHHPNLIKRAEYQKVLMKQNSVVDSDGIVFRWDTESIQNTQRIVDEILEFIGDIHDYHHQYSYKETRAYKLYEHQEEYIAKIHEHQNQGFFGGFANGYWKNHHRH